MAKQTAMMDLRADLVKSIESSLQALSEINNSEIKEACQKTVSITLKSVIKRIDDELLAMEREQIEDAFNEAVEEGSTWHIDGQGYFVNRYGGTNG